MMGAETLRRRNILKKEESFGTGFSDAASKLETGTAEDDSVDMDLFVEVGVNVARCGGDGDRVLTVGIRLVLSVTIADRASEGDGECPVLSLGRGSAGE